MNIIFSQVQQLLLDKAKSNVLVELPVLIRVNQLPRIMSLNPICKYEISRKGKTQLHQVHQEIHIPHLDVTNNN